MLQESYARKHPCLSKPKIVTEEEFASHKLKVSNFKKQSYLEIKSNRRFSTKEEKKRRGWQLNLEKK